MGRFLTFVEPTPTELQDWVATSQIGDGCQVATRGRKPIRSLTKVGLSMVWWSLTDIGKQSNGFAVSMRFSEVLRIWTAAQAANPVSSRIEEYIAAGGRGCMCHLHSTEAIVGP